MTGWWGSDRSCSGLMFGCEKGHGMWPVSKNKHWLMAAAALPLWYCYHFSQARVKGTGNDTVGCILGREISRENDSSLCGVITEHDTLQMASLCLKQLITSCLLIPFSCWTYHITCIVSRSHPHQHIHLEQAAGISPGSWLSIPEIRNDLGCLEPFISQMMQI